MLLRLRECVLLLLLIEAVSQLCRMGIVPQSTVLAHVFPHREILIEYGVNLNETLRPLLQLIFLDQKD